MREDNRGSKFGSRTSSRDNRSNQGGGFRSNFNGPRDDGPREMHQATCDECHNSCEVPFKPTEGKPVYCRDCYRKRKPRY
ncbi:MAG: CxxC-x17-CxxC domain-containing protein [Candidatus Woesearchaeota archaeon]